MYKTPCVVKQNWLLCVRDSDHHSQKNLTCSLLAELSESTSLSFLSLCVGVFILLSRPCFHIHCNWETQTEMQLLFLFVKLVLLKSERVGRLLALHRNKLASPFVYLLWNFLLRVKYWKCSSKPRWGFKNIRFQTCCINWKDKYWYSVTASEFPYNFI